MKKTDIRHCPRQTSLWDFTMKFYFVINDKKKSGKRMNHLVYNIMQFKRRKIVRRNFIY